MLVNYNNQTGLISFGGGGGSVGCGGVGGVGGVGSSFIEYIVTMGIWDYGCNLERFSFIPSFFLFWFAFYNVVSYFNNHVIRNENFLQLSPLDKSRWNDIILSTTNSIVLFYNAVLLFYNDPNVHVSILKSNQIVISNHVDNWIFYLQFVYAYFLFDLSRYFYDWYVGKGFHKDSLVIGIHHYLCFGGMTPVLLYQRYVGLPVIFSFAELSTPILNYRLFLYLTGKKNTELFYRVTVCLTVLFIICRLFNGFICLILCLKIDTFSILQNENEKFIFLCISVINLCGNMYWFKRLLASVDKGAKNMDIY